MSLAMRTCLSALGVAMALAAGTQPASAQRYYPWCYNEASIDGAPNCGFNTWEQCMANRHGVAGFCQRNPWYEALGSGELQATPRKPVHRAR
jgi:Protein of unknown function (DUF3551)